MTPREAWPAPRVRRRYAWGEAGHRRRAHRERHAAPTDTEYIDTEHIETEHIDRASTPSNAVRRNAMTGATPAAAATSSTATTTGAAGTTGVTAGSPGRLAEDSGQGRTTIAASVVQKIAGIAAREISGVYAMGGGVSRAFGAIRERIPGGGTGAANISGVQVEVGEKQAAIDLDIIVEYGASIVELARAVRRNVITAVERMTGLEVIEVNIAVNDIHLPELDDADDAPATVTSRVE
ncbi:hypothetical protein PSD17_56130 [Pseudonocardia sp. D17]|nr:hypothetical protein PSD17_56130 [Pseudonocardia sp. D17]